MLIVVPTTELAIQIANQAKELLTYHNNDDTTNVMCMYGGTKLTHETRQLSSKPLPTILVATPGRLLDHIDRTRINGKHQRGRKFSDILSKTNIVVLDEMDRLFGGFSKEIRKILSFLPRPEKRQTLLFSATIPKKLRSFLTNTMKINYSEIDCVSSGGSSSNDNFNSDNKKKKNKTNDIVAEINPRLQQSYFELESMEHYVTGLVAIVQKAILEEGNNGNSKILVFLPAVKLVRYFAVLFNEGLQIPVLEIHSRMSHSSRLRVSNTFKNAKRGVLFTSDVSARGKYRKYTKNEKEIKRRNLSRLFERRISLNPLLHIATQELITRTFHLLYNTDFR